MNSIRPSRRIACKELTRESFGRYGDVIELPDKAPDIVTPHNRYYDDVVSFDPGPEGVQVGFVEILRRPMLFNTMECHLKASQAWIPLGGTSAVICVAEPTAKASAPAVAQVEAFIFDGAQGVCIRPGVWHHLLFPLASRSQFVMLLKRETMQDDMNVLEIVPADQPLAVDLSMLSAGEDGR